MSTLSKEELDTILSQLNTLSDTLPDAPDLTAEQRRSKRRIGESGAYEISEMAALLRQTSNYLPGTFGWSVAEFQDQATEQENWQVLERAAQRFLERVSDARIARGGTTFWSGGVRGRCCTACRSSSQETTR